jgi:hypothetical protein
VSLTYTVTSTRRHTRSTRAANGRTYAHVLFRGLLVFRIRVGSAEIAGPITLDVDPTRSFGFR